MNSPGVYISHFLSTRQHHPDFLNAPLLTHRLDQGGAGYLVMFSFFRGTFKKSSLICLCIHPAKLSEAITSPLVALLDEKRKIFLERT
jgi:hypothetical protein